MLTDLERIEAEAKAKMTWGEEPAAVLLFLKQQGLDDAKADEMMADLKDQRIADVCEAGRSKLIKGGALIASPVVFYLVCAFLGAIPFKLFMLTIAAGCYGIWVFIGGCINLFAPNFGNEDLSD